MPAHIFKKFFLGHPNVQYIFSVHKWNESRRSIFSIAVQDPRNLSLSFLGINESYAKYYNNKKINRLWVSRKGSIFFLHFQENSRKQKAEFMQATSDIQEVGVKKYLELVKSYSCG